MLQRFAHLAIIPARGGSKRIPGKNLVQLGAKPLLQYTLEAASGCAELDRIVLTTDNEEIRNTAIRLGFNVPFLRPAALATDDASSFSAVMHVLDWLAEHESYHPDTVVLLQPTSPFRTAADVTLSIRAFERAGKQSLLSVSPPLQSPRDLVCVANGRLLSRERVPDQRCDEVFINGAIYIATVNFLRSTGQFYDCEAELLVIDPIKGFDIDTPAQLEVAQRLALSGSDLWNSE
jgi:CMP-N,N'-diacetyllegionaminic acid synthase